MMETVAVLMPSKGRAEQLKRNIQTLLESNIPDGVDMCLVFAVCDDDWETIGVATELQSVNIHVTKRNPGSTAVQGWNQAADCATFSDWFVLGADDIVWHEGWLEAAMECARRTKAQVIGLNDGHTDLQHYGAHYMVHRDFINTQLDGVFIPPEYKSWWFDREICERAASLGVYAPCPEAMAEHLHPDWGTAPDDETYQAGKPHHDADKAVYWQRTGRSKSKGVNDGG